MSGAFQVVVVDKGDERDAGAQSWNGVTNNGSPVNQNRNCWPGPDRATPETSAS